MSWLTGSSPNLKKVDLLTPGQQRLLDKTINLANRGLSGDYDVYGRQIGGGRNQLHKAFFDQVRGLFGTPQQSLMNDTAARLMSGQPAYEIDPTARQDLYESQFKIPAMRQFREETLPQVSEFYNARGLGRSGQHERALLDSGERLAEGLGGIQAGLMYADEEARRQSLENAANRSISGVQLGLGIGQQNLANIGALGGAAELKRGLRAERRGEAYQKWMAQQPYANPYLGFLNTGLGTQAYGFYNQPGQAGVLGNILSLVGAGIGGYYGGPMGASAGMQGGQLTGQLFQQG